MIGKKNILRNISWVFNFAISVKIRKKVSLNINFSIVNECNCYQICYRNSNPVTISREMYTNVYIPVLRSYFDQILKKRKSQTRQVFNFTVT